MVKYCLYLAYDVKIFCTCQIELNMLIGAFITPTRGESSAGKVFVDALVLEDEMKIGEHAELLDLKEVTILGSC